MKSEPKLEDLEQLGLILASVNDILTATYKQAARLFPKNLWALKSFDFNCRNLEKIREGLETYAFKFYGVEDLDVFYPPLRKRGFLVYPECFAGDDDDDDV